MKAGILFGQEKNELKKGRDRSDCASLNGLLNKVIDNALRMVPLRLLANFAQLKNESAVGDTLISDVHTKTSIVKVIVMSQTQLPASQIYTIASVGHVHRMI